MIFTQLNPATQQLEETQADGSTLFVKLQVHENYGSALLNTSRFVLVSLDSLVVLVADRLAVLEAADTVEAKPKPTRKRVAA